MGPTRWARSRERQQTNRQCSQLPLSPCSVLPLGLSFPSAQRGGKRTPPPSSLLVVTSGEPWSDPKGQSRRALGLREARVGGGQVQPETGTNQGRVREQLFLPICDGPRTLPGTPAAWLGPSSLTSWYRALSSRTENKNRLQGLLVLGLRDSLLPTQEMGWVVPPTIWG